MAAMSGAWLCKKVRHPWLGGPRRLTMYLATLDCATSNPSLSSSPWMRGAPQSFRVAKFGVVEPNVPRRHHDTIEFPDGSNVLVTLLVEGQRATVLQLPVVHQISERTTKAEEHGSTPAAAASAVGRSCEG